MSKLDDLLQTLCPNGVERVQVKKAFQRLRGTPITAGKMKEIGDPTGEIRIFAGGKTIINAKEKDIPNANITRVPAVLVQSRGVIDVVYYDKPFTFKNEMWAYTTENKTTVKYLYYVLKNNVQSFRDAASGMGSLPQISLPVTEDFYIPLPPLAVQQEIVRILDSFTELTAELNEKLASELTTRRKQYEHYRDELLTFGDNISKSQIAKLASISRGKVLSKEYLKENAGGYPVYSSQTENNGMLGKINSYMFDGEYITWTTDGANAGTVFYRNGQFSITNVCGIINVTDNRVLPKYLFYILQREAPTYVNKGMGNPKLMSNVMEKISVPIPSLARQKNIVSVLERFEAICKDLTSGLPAEIAARQKQYEYYRDKLLTFKELDT